MKRILFALLFIVACTREEPPTVSCRFTLQESRVLTRAADPDETRISDYNLFIFNAQGILEERVYVPARTLKLTDGKVQYSTRLMRDVPYIILAGANLGYELPFRTLEDALEYRYPLAYPDEYSQGIPMAARVEGTPAGEDWTVEVPLERLMARLDISIDRRALDRDVSFKVRELRIGGCPSSVRMFGPSRARNRDEVFTGGFLKDGHETDPLNRDITLGESGTVSLYMLENCQGDLLQGVETEQGKVFTEGHYDEICSYVELRAEYSSASYHTKPSTRLIYRFYPGENPGNFDIRRNCIYRITIRPEGSGLSEDSWRVDKTGVLEGPAQ